MAVFQTSPEVKKKWLQMERQEKKFLKKQSEQKDSILNTAVEKHVPDKLAKKLDGAFLKAFDFIFKKGSGIIEKTYDREKHKTLFRANRYMEYSTREIRDSRHAAGSRRKNLAISAVEGLGFGALGIGIPDIPVFTGLILKGVYETALSYGFEYDSPEEQLFILSLIEGSMLHGDQLYAADRRINKMIYKKKKVQAEDIEDQLARTSKSLSSELVCMKFLQTIPVAGIAGGAYDIVFLNRILTTLGRIISVVHALLKNLQAVLTHHLKVCCATYAVILTVQRTGDIVDCFRTMHANQMLYDFLHNRIVITVYIQHVRIGIVDTHAGNMAVSDSIHQASSRLIAVYGLRIEQNTIIFSQIRKIQNRKLAFVIFLVFCVVAHVQENIVSFFFCCLPDTFHNLSLAVELQAPHKHHNIHRLKFLPRYSVGG